MTRIVHPPQQALEVMEREAPGGEPAGISLVVPAVTRPGEPFPLKAAVVDGRGHATRWPRGSLYVKCPGVLPRPIRVRFPENKPAVAVVEGIRIPAEGFHRFHADLEGLPQWSNPTLCASASVPGLYWGDPHLHTNLGACHLECTRSLTFCYAAARFLSGLDWVSVTDHVSNGRGDRSKWKEQGALCDLHDAPGSFATLPAYEASFRSAEGGDNNVYLSRHIDMFLEECGKGTVRSLCGNLRASLRGTGAGFFVVPHHTSRADKHVEMEDGIYPGPDCMPLLEIASKWGTSEHLGNPSALGSAHDGPSYAADFLKRGMMLGFVAGTDSHASLTFGRGEEPAQLAAHPGITAVRAPSLTREALFDGLRGRNCYAASLERTYLDVDLCGITMGRKTGWPRGREPRQLQVTAAGQGPLDTVEIIRNGQVIHCLRVDDWKTSLRYEDRDDLEAVCLPAGHLGRAVHYYVRVTCRSGARAWSSPIWLILP